MKLPTLKSAMTPFPHSVEVDAPLQEARDLMRSHDFHHLPVTEAHKLVGVISERDIMAAQGRGGDAARLAVRDVCVAGAYVGDLEEPIEDVLLTMAERHIGSAIVTRKGRLAGVFTSMDVCRSFGEFLLEYFPRPGGGQAA